MGLTLARLIVLVPVALSVRETFADTFLEIASEPGDPLGQGVQLRFTPEESTVKAAGDSALGSLVPG